MLATIWERLQQDPIHVLVLCASAAGSVLLVAAACRIFMNHRWGISPKQQVQSEERELAQQE